MLHPRFGAVGFGGAPGAPLSSGPNRFRQYVAGLQETVGNQAVVRLLRSGQSAEERQTSAAPTAGTPVAIQRMAADATPISADGQELPQLVAPATEGGGDSLDDETVLAQIEQGNPAAGQDDSVAGQGNSTSQQQEEVGAVQTKAEPGEAGPASISPQAVLARMGSGEPMQSSMRADMESALGHDFSKVRIHTDGSARALARTLGAHAFTIGEHVAFGPGLYRGNTADSRRLVAHELTHVVQQRRGLSGNILRKGIGDPGDLYEQEADAVAERISRRAPSTSASRPTLTTHQGKDASAVQCFSGADAATYAKTWALKTNPKYPRFPDNDCTNFVSQSMEAGGWSYNWGSDMCDDRKKDSVWWYKKDGCTRIWPLANINASHTWGGAHNFYHFAKSSGRATAASHIYDLGVGDVLQRDHGDGQIHHSMVVTKKGTETVDGVPNIVQLWVSYHTTDTLERNFWGTGGFFAATPAGYNFYAWKIT